MSTDRSDDTELFIETSARLHFGVLDLNGSLGRWFGGIGTAAPEPRLRLSARADDELIVSGEDAGRADAFARRFLDFHRIRGGARLHVHRALPSHAGLGSGTQLALSVARVLAELHDVSTDVIGLARAVGRAQRSAIGTWTFAGGGLVLEGGRPRHGEGCGPLIARIPMPDTWRCVVAVPRAGDGLSGDVEAGVFDALRPPPEREIERVSHLVLMALLPAAAEADLPTFGSALTEIQQVTGQWFATAQGGSFAPGASSELIRFMTGWGAPGVGQSSWGPAVYAIVHGEDAALELSEELRDRVGVGGQVYSGPFRHDGARVWRA